MEGYHIEWFSKNKRTSPINAERIHQYPQNNNDSILSSNLSQLSAVNNDFEKNIVIEKHKTIINQIVFAKDTLPEKKNENALPISDSAKKNTIPLALLLLASAIIIPFVIAYFVAPYSIIPGLVFWVGFITSLIFLVISIRNHYQQKHRPEDSRKISPKSIMAFLFACLTVPLFFATILATVVLYDLTYLFIISAGLWLITAVAAYILSIKAQKQIKANKEKYWGKFFVIISRIIIWSTIFLAAYASIFLFL